MRCTVAGTSAGSEPTWPTANNGTVASGTATFTNVTGQSTYFWTAAAGDIPTLIGAVGTFRFAGGDRMFVSSDHSETQTAASVFGTGTGTPSFSGCQVLSVNRAGSTPPVAADLLAGATVVCSGASLTIEHGSPTYHYGINYSCSGTVGLFFGGGSHYKTSYFDACQLYLSGAGSSAALIATSQASTVALFNTTIRFANVAQKIIVSTGILEISWVNTPSAIAGATIPTVLFAASVSYPTLATVRGVDLSAITTTLVDTNSGSATGGKFLFDSCKIASGVTRYSNSGLVNTRDLVELVNCYDGTNFISESYQPAGAVTTEFTITLSGGATDNVGTFAHKMVSNTNVDKYVNTLHGFWMDLNYATTGGSKTATVEIISSASLNNDEISLQLEYLGTASSSVASFASSLPATVLTTAAAVTTSTATWNSSPATPVKQKLQVTFTPQTVGRLRGRVRLGKASTTCYYNPQITVT